MPKGYVFAVFIFLEVIEPRYWSLRWAVFYLATCSPLAGCRMPLFSSVSLSLSLSVCLSISLSINFSISLPSIGFLSREHW